MTKREARWLALDWCAHVLRSDIGAAEPPPECKTEQDEHEWGEGVLRVAATLQAMADKIGQPPRFRTKPEKIDRAGWPKQAEPLTPDQERGEGE